MGGVDDKGADRAHGGTIMTESPNQMLCMDAASTVTREEGPVTVFVAVDHGMHEDVAVIGCRKKWRRDSHRLGVQEIRSGTA